MKARSKFYGLVGSFFSRGLYRDAGLYWHGAGMGYLLMLVSICALAQAVKVHIGFRSFVRTEASAVIRQIPAITIKDGQVSCDAPQPCYIKNPDTDEAVVVIDTTGSITSLDGQDARVLVTKTAVIVKKNRYETRTLDLSSVRELQLTQDRVSGWLQTCSLLLGPLMFVCMLIGSFVFRIVQALAYAGIGMGFAAMTGARITYAGAMRIAVLAVTPVMIVRTVLDMAGLLPPFAWFLFLVMAMVYLFIGVQACARKDEKEAPVPAPVPLFVP